MGVEERRVEVLDVMGGVIVVEDERGLEEERRMGAEEGVVSGFPVEGLRLMKELLTLRRPRSNTTIT